MKMTYSKVKILVAEDDINTIEEITKCIEEANCEVTSVVDNALEAITKTELEKPDLILMDIRLNSSLSGIDAAKIISYRTSTPVVFLTSIDDIHLLKNTSLPDSAEYVLKPVDNFILKKTVERNLIKYNLRNVFYNNHIPPNFSF